ncbi:PepSY-associated TM region [Aquimarina amphilecti]|uniref:PepSY-associated TM region n=1 Tax=Aquimarina amphilecti TaxID=1038014 RepID=A0A1H7RZN6_AQUAM|nr:PepSY domain-containing protein [Aquimarina amphilecti]SEL64827.1 PepSY-associated TM region [Aquimarina amphilecti]
MVKRKTAILIRKAHRYLGIFLGIQFLMWTISGLYFSWTDIDEIHGDQFKKELKPMMHTNLLGLDSISPVPVVSSLELRTIVDEPYYWVNDSILIHAKSGKVKSKITEEEALQVASAHMLTNLEVSSVDFITEVGKHHEYRGRSLPAFVISYNHPEHVKAYVSAIDGSFQRVRHQSWRWFDFLWMTHTMDYEGRDDFNTIVLRIFSLLGLITVLSGFLLWYISSPTLRKVFKR